MKTYNPFSLVNKKILITGASSGIGKAIAIECSKMGADLIISGRNQSRLQETFNLLSNVGHAHTQVIYDFNNLDDIPNFTEEMPKLDGVVHCAGFTKSLLFQFMTREILDSVMNVNFSAPTLISQNLLKTKKIGKGCSIVFISSISGILCSFYANSIYSASKGAINGMIKGMAIDLAPKGIRVNSINPGMIETNFLANGIISDEQIKEDIKRYPLKRYGKPEDVAFAAIYLLSDTSQWITGSNFVIDGGYTLL